MSTRSSIRISRSVGSIRTRPTWCFAPTTKSYLEPSAMSTVRLEMVAAQVSPTGAVTSYMAIRGSNSLGCRHKSIRFVSRMTTLFRSGLRSQTSCDHYFNLLQLPAELLLCTARPFSSEGAAFVVCGWSETGKTETALALAELWARFISDKWTVIDSDARIHAFPVSVGIRDWVLDYVPRLQGAPANVTAGASARLSNGAPCAPCLARAGASPLAGAAESQLERVLTLTGRLSLRQTEVAAIYGSAQDPTATPPLVTLAMLTTVPGEEVTVREAEVGWTAQRLAQSAAYERRSLYELDARVRYASAQPGPSPLLGVAGREAELLRNSLAGVRLLEVEAPVSDGPQEGRGCAGAMVLTQGPGPADLYRFGPDLVLSVRGDRRARAHFRAEYACSGAGQRTLGPCCGGDRGQSCHDGWCSRGHTCGGVARHAQTGEVARVRTDHTRCRLNACGGRRPRSAGTRARAELHPRAAGFACLHPGPATYLCRAPRLPATGRPSC